MEQRLTFITLGVGNLVVSRKFYQDTFGWEPEPNSGGDVVFFKLNGIVLSLFPREELAKDAGVSSQGSGFRSFSLAHNVRSEQEVDTLISELRSKGVSVMKEPQKAFWGGYTSYIADPDGNLWEIAYNPLMPLDKDGSVSSKTE
ncbi:MAG: VOC family protein [Bacteriovoracaceae bacterium]|nr:VOC family protein [Bacteroidota bacterium]